MKQSQILALKTLARGRISLLAMFDLQAVKDREVVQVVSIVAVGERSVTKESLCVPSVSIWAKNANGNLGL